MVAVQQQSAGEARSRCLGRLLELEPEPELAMRARAIRATARTKARTAMDRAAMQRAIRSMRPL